MLEIELKELLDKYREGKCTAQETADVDNWYLHLLKTSALKDEEIPLSEMKQRIWENIHAHKTPVRNNKKIYTILTAAAAAAAIILVIVKFVSYPGSTIKSDPSAIADFRSGKNNATIKLSNGQIIDITHAKIGTLASLDGVNISKSADDKIIYKTFNTPESHSAIGRDSIRIPNGKLYTIALPDGTEVNLNAGSTLSYPTRFAEDERSVSLSGEGYFAISKLPSKPFKVVGFKQVVKVLGTHFNVSCYDHEPIRTTLEEGKVSVESFKGETKLLVPGQQAILTDQSFSTKNVSPEDVTGWKDGLFVFNETPLREALQQISRWYDVEVDIDFNNIKNEPTLDAEWSKTDSLGDILINIEKMTRIKLVQNGRRIIL